MSIWRADFWRATAERAIKTFAQTAGSLIVADQVPGLLEVDWLGIASAAGLATLLSVLFSIGSNAATQTGPSLGNAEIVPPTDPAVRVAENLPPVP